MGAFDDLIPEQGGTATATASNPFEDLIPKLAAEPGAFPAPEARIVEPRMPTPRTGEMSTIYGGPPKAFIPRDYPELISEAAGESLLSPKVDPNEPHISTPRIPISKDDPFLLAAGKEVVNVAKSVPEFFTSDIGIASAIVGKLSPRFVTGAFAVDLAKSATQQAQQLVAGWKDMTPAEKATNLVDILGSMMFAIGTGKHALGKTETTLPRIVAPVQAAPPPMQQQMDNVFQFALPPAGEGYVPPGVKPPEPPRTFTPAEPEPKGEPTDARQIPSPAPVPQLEVRPPVGQTPPLRQQGQAALPQPPQGQEEAPNQPEAVTPPKVMTADEAEKSGHTITAYRGVSKSKPFNDSGTVWLTTNRDVAEAYAKDTFGYDDADVIEVRVNPKDIPRHDIRKLSQSQLDSLDPDQFGNPQKVGIYDNSDDSLLGSNHPHTAIHVPMDRVAIIKKETKAEGVAPHEPPRATAGALVPALNVEGEPPITGPGTHADIANAAAAKARADGDIEREMRIREALARDENHIFLDQDGKPLSREAAAPVFNELTGKNLKQVHSEDLIAAGLQPEAPKAKLTPGQKETLRQQLASSMQGRTIPAADLAPAHFANEVRLANQRVTVQGGEPLPANLTWDDAIKAGVLEVRGKEVGLPETPKAPLPDLTQGQKEPTVPVAVAPETITSTAPPVAAVGGDVGKATEMGAEEGVIPPRGAATPSFRPRKEITAEIQDAESGLKAVNTALGKMEKLGVSGSKRTRLEKKAQKLESTLATLRAELAERDKAIPQVRGYARGVTRFDNETARTGDDILSWIKDSFGKMMSRTAAQKRGGDFWRRNQGDFDGAIDLNLPPHHSAAIYDSSGGGSLPNQVAQAAYDAGRLKEPTPQALWDAIRKASAARKGGKSAETAEEAIQQREQAEYEAWIKATKAKTKDKNVNVAPDQLAVGDILEVAGEEVEVTGVTPEGDVELKDGRKFGIQKLTPESKPFWVEKWDKAEDDTGFAPDETIAPQSGTIEPKPATEAPVPATTPPKLRPGEKAGEMFQGADQPFNLAGEKATDFERIQREKEEAAKRAAEAKALADKQQLDLLAGKPAVEPELPPAQQAIVDKAADPFAVGKKIRFGNNPQPWTIVAETTDPKFPDERLFQVKNDRTGDVEETGTKGITPIQAREAGAKAPKRDLDAELRALKLDPSVFPDKASKMAAIKREKEKGGDLSIDESQPAANRVFRDRTGLSDVHRAAVEKGRQRLASLLRFKLLPKTLQELEPDFTGRGEEDGYALSSSARASLEQVFGQQIVFLDTTGIAALRGWNGVVFDGIPGYIFINAQSPKPFLTVFGHEFAHSLERTDPQLYRELIENLKPIMDLNKGSFWSTLAHTYWVRRLATPTQERAYQELASDFIGDSVSDPAFWEHLAKRDGNLFVRVGQAVIAFFKDVAMRLHKMGSYEHIRNIEEGHRIVADALSKFAASKKKTPDAGAGDGFSLSVEPSDVESDREQTQRRNRFRQIAGQKIGAEYTPENIRVLEDNVRTMVFSGVNEPVTPERTLRAKEIFDKMVNPDTRNQYASQLEQQAGYGAAGIVRNELWGYAVNMLQTKDDASLFNAMRLRSAEIQTMADLSRDAADYGIVGDSKAGFHLRLAREMVMQGLWRPIIAYTNEQLAAAGRVIGVGKDAFRNIMDAINRIAQVANPDEWENFIRTGKDSAGLTLEEHLGLNSPEHKAAEEVVEQTIPTKGGPEAIPAGPKRKSILETVYKWLAKDIPKTYGDQFKNDLSQELMANFNLREDKATEIAEQTWNRKVNIVSEKTRRLLDAELRSLDNLAEKTAQDFISKWEQAEWIKPQKDNAIRDLVINALKSPGELDRNNILGLRSSFQKLLVEHGLSPHTAELLTQAVWAKREENFLNANMKAMQRASESLSLKSLIESINSSPYLAQKDPEWRLDTARRWFESNGLSPDAAKVAAKMFDQKFREAFERAAVKVAEQALHNPEHPSIPKLIKAIRAGLADPQKEWPAELAKLNGFKDITPEQAQKLAELEKKHSDPAISPEEQVAYVEEMMGIMRHVGDQTGHTLKTIAESFAYSLLSGIKTLTLHVFQPPASMFGDLLVHAPFEPRDFPMLLKQAFTALGTWKPAFTYAWNHDAYSFSVEQMGFHTNELKRQYEIAQREFAAGQYLKAIPRFILGYEHFVGRALMAANQAGMRVVQRWKLAMYGSMALRQAGYGTKEIGQMVDWAAGMRKAHYEELLTRYSKNDAAAIADHWANDEMLKYFSKHLQEPVLADKVSESSFYEAFSRVGRRAPAVGETEEGFLSNLGVNQLMQFTSKMRSEGGPVSMLNIMAVGFMNIPLRLARFYANYSAYGLVRYGIHRWMQNPENLGAARLRRWAGDRDTFWNQSFKTDLQAQAHLREALIGTGLMLAFGAWQHYHHTSDDDAEKRPFGLFVTGHGPSNKTMLDSWRKRGYRPYSLNIVVGGRVVGAVPITRAGEILAYPLGLAAAQDDLAWRRKQEEAIGRGKKEPFAREALAAAATYYEIIGAQGIFQAFGRITQLQRGSEAGVGRAIGLTAASAAGGLLPFHGLLNSVEGLIWGPVDRTSTEAGMLANIPILNVWTNGRAVNRFGDFIGDRSWFARMADTGIPFAFRVSDTPENKALYQMVLDKGAAPPDLRRYIVEEKYGPLSQSEWQKFAQTSGETLKQTVLDNLDTLKTMPAQAVRQFMVQAGDAANAQAAAAMKLEPVEQPGRALAGGGGGTGGGSAAAGGAMLPSAPKMASLGLPSAPSGGGSRVTGTPRAVSGGSAAVGGAIGPVSRPVGSVRLSTRGGMTRHLTRSGLSRPRIRLVSGRLRARSGRVGRIKLAGGRKRRRVSLKG